jgi:hypothetical protein
MIETIDLNWREDDRGLSLHLRQAKSPLLWVVADATYPGMWRIRLPDDRLSDMVNLERAKDAALSVALGALNPKTGYRESRPEAPPARSSGWSAVQPPNAAFNRPQAEIRAIED